MSLVALEKRKRKKNRTEIRIVGRQGRKTRNDSSLCFQIVIGNQINPPTVAVPGYGCQTGTVPKFSDFTCRLALT